MNIRKWINRIWRAVMRKSSLATSYPDPLDSVDAIGFYERVTLWITPPTRYNNLEHQKSETGKGHNLGKSQCH